MAQLYQNDPRWQGQKIGLQSNLTISQVGCLLTSMAMIVNHYGGNTTPMDLNNLMKANGGFSGAWIKAAQVPDAFPNLGMKRQHWVQCDNAKAPLDLIDLGLAAGSLIAVRVDWSADPGIQGHWVVLYEKVGNDYLIWDPWHKQDASDKLTDRYGFNSKDPADIILEAIWHGKGDFPPPVGATTAAPSSSVRKETPVAKQAPNQSNGSLAVKPTINQLSMRQQPVNGNIVKLLSTTDVLLVIEGANAASKIGQQNQWLHVRLGDGTEGYVAAWYVKQTETPIMAPAQPAAAPAAAASQPAPTPPNAAATATAVVPVKTTADMVSLRSQPRVANDTFMCTLAKGTALMATEANATTKVGQQNQWLQVRTNDGKEGYVAAWLVAKS